MEQSNIENRKINDKPTYYVYVKGYPPGIIISKNKNSYNVQFSQLNDKIVSISKNKCLIYDSLQSLKDNHTEKFIQHIPLKDVNRIINNYNVIDITYHPFDNTKIIKLIYLINRGINDEGEIISMTIGTIYANKETLINNYKLTKLD
jgi:hypothetical protein